MARFTPERERQLLATDRPYPGRKKWISPKTGKVYDLEHGDVIDPEEEGMGCAGAGTPNPIIGNREVYDRIFIRLKTPAETLMCKPIENSEDFARRVSIIENWYRNIVRKGNFILEFSAVQITDEEVKDLMNK